MADIYRLTDQLVAYALANELIEKEDQIWARNELLAVLGLTDYKPSSAKVKTPKTAAEILTPMCDWAAAHGLISPDTVTQRDLFDTRLMNVFAARPSEVISEFALLWPKTASGKPPRPTESWTLPLTCPNPKRTPKILPPHCK